MNNDVPYKKVLVFSGEPFNRITGFGITINNLFKDWPSNSIANVYYNSTIKYDDTICEKSYKLGSSEYKSSLLYSVMALVVKFIIIIKFIPRYCLRRLSKNTQSLHNKSFGFNFMHFKRYFLSDAFIKWLEEFRPDIIYCIVVNLSDIVFVQSLVRKTDAKLVVHILDDWIGNIDKNSDLLNKLTSVIIDTSVKKLFNDASLLFCIGEAMCGEYAEKYGKVFYPFQNCPDTDVWLRHSRKEWLSRDYFDFVFTGAIYDNFNKESILDFVKALHKLNASCNLKFRLTIYTFNDNHDFISTKYLSSCVDVKKVPDGDDEIAKIYGNADSLLLPFDFNESSVNLSRLSMPTKLPTYMLSSTPIFVLGPLSCCAVRFLHENAAAYIVNEIISNEYLENKILEFADNATLRRSLAMTAQQVAINNFSAKAVRPHFVAKLRAL